MKSLPSVPVRIQPRPHLTELAWQERLPVENLDGLSMMHVPNQPADISNTGPACLRVVGGCSLDVQCLPLASPPASSIS